MSLTSSGCGMSDSSKAFATAANNEIKRFRALSYLS
jgi:hypothetical protein